MTQETNIDRAVWREPWIWVVGVWVAALLLGASRIPAIHSTLRVSAAFVGLIAIPGWLTGEILLLRQRWSRVQSIALELVLGLMEALIAGQVAVLVGLPTLVLAVSIVVIGVGKLIWLARRPLATGMAREPVTMALRLQLLVLLIAAIWVLSAVLAIPDHPQQSYNDFWNYLAVQSQFSANHGDLNLSDGVLISSLNARLRWNPWLYSLAMLTDYTGVHPVTLVDRDIRLALFLMAMVVAIAFARELLGKRSLAYSTGLLHLLFMLVSADQFLDMRVVEDKYFSLLILFPAVFMVALRMLDRPTRRDWWLTGGVLVGVALIHPFNAPAVVVAVLAFVLVYTLLNWQTVPRRDAVGLVGLMVLLVAVPVLQQILISRDPVVAATLGSKSSVGLGYHLPFPAISGWYRVDTIFNVGFAVIMVGAVVLALRDRAALFLSTLVISLAFVMWIPPVSGLFTRLVTTSQALRIALVMPVGYAWGWCFSKLDDLAWPAKQRKPVVLAALSMVPFVAQVGLWLVNPYPVQMSLTYWAFEDAMWDALDAGEEIIQDASVLVSPKLSTYAPIFWPDAHYSLRYKASTQFDNSDIMDLFGPDPLATAQAVTTRYGFEYLAIERSFPLDQLIRTDWPCCQIEFENESVTIARVLYDIAPVGLPYAQPEVPVEAQFGDIALLTGYSLEQQLDSVQVSLSWQPLQDSAVPLTVFVHLIGPYNPATEGPLWAQDDHPPRMGQISTTTWTREEVWVDAYRLDTEGIPAGEYEVWVGVYDPTTGERLSVLADDNHSAFNGGQASHLVLQPLVLSD